MDIIEQYKNVCYRLVRKACNVQHKCDYKSHKAALYSLYYQIVKGLYDASAGVFGRMYTADQANCASYINRINGWTELIKISHDLARQHFLNQMFAGKPKDGAAFNEMKVHRARFKSARSMSKRNNERK